MEILRVPEDKMCLHARWCFSIQPRSHPTQHGGLTEYPRAALKASSWCTSYDVRWPGWLRALFPKC
eukprot:1141432-Pelagomonas_calceolata.AAC.2